MAEWSCSGLQSRLRRFDSGFSLQVNMNIAIIGYGFVGKALDKGIKNDIKKIYIDPNLKTKITDLKDFNPDLIFICVPTPMKNDGSQDTNILDNVLHEIAKINLDSIIVIKSTLLPDMTKEYTKINSKIVINPEFLRERSAFQDFISSPFILIGAIQNIPLKLKISIKNFLYVKLRIIMRPMQYQHL